MSATALASSRAYRRRHRAQKLCIRCTAPAAVDWDGKVLHACERHLRMDRKRKRGPRVKTVKIDFKKRTVKETSASTSR